eukprot:Opistho-2@94683
MTPALLLDDTQSAYSFQSSSALEQSMPCGLTATSLEALPFANASSEKFSLNPNDPIAVAALQAAQRIMFSASFAAASHNFFGNAPFGVDASSDLSDFSDGVDPMLDAFVGFPDDMMVPEQLEDIKPFASMGSTTTSGRSSSVARSNVGRRGRPAPIYDALRENMGPLDPKVEKYLDRRKRNNAAAKKCRDAKKAKEDQIVSVMEQLRAENAKLRDSVSTLESELRRLREAATNAPSK